MNRTTLLNSLIAKIDAKSYLEIGINDGANFNKICCAKRVGVDPLKRDLEGKNFYFYQKTSDEFFSSLDAGTKYDVIFIDGLHTREQVTKDILNAMAYLSDKGYIVCHDMNPQHEEHQTPEFNGGHWNGDGWKAFVDLRSKVAGWNFVTVDTDEGCGVIFRDNATNFTNDLPLTWENLIRNRVAWLNLMSVKDFTDKYLIHYGINDNHLKMLLNAYLGDPGYDENNFAIAQYYDGIGQKASAVSFYIRAAERSSNVFLQYESLIRAALCFIAQGTRGLSVRGLLQRAMALLPNRPEAYFLLSRWWEREASVEGWVNCYTLAAMGLELANITTAPLRTWVEYPGAYGLQFEKAVSGWWVGQCEESRALFLELYNNPNVDSTHRQAVINNLKFMENLTGKKLIPVA